jgi:hypothetical protein
MRQDRWMRRQENYIILINIKVARLTHWNQKAKTKKSDQLIPTSLSCLRIRTVRYKSKETSASFSQMLMSCKAPWMGRRTKRIKGMSSKGKS